MNIKRNIIFALEARKKAGVPVIENVPIRMRVVYMGDRIEFTTGYRIDVSKWDNEKQKVKNGCTNKLKQSASEINADLLKYENEIHEIFKEFEVANIVPSKEQIKKTFNDRVTKKVNIDSAIPVKSEPSVWEIHDMFTKECGKLNIWTKATYQKHSALKKHLQDFEPNLKLELLDENQLSEFLYFLQEVKDMKNSTILKQFGFLKWFLRWAKKDYKVNSSFVDFKPKLKTIPKKIVFFTLKEIKQLADYEIPESKKYLERVRDVFVFQCFTSLRYSDVFNLKRSDIKDTYIDITTIKTSDSLMIELNKYSQAILDKYTGIEFEREKVLPVISNQKMNDYLKELAELTGFNEPIRETYYKGNQRFDIVSPKFELIGTHTARRSFICNALILGIPAHVVMKWTGHSDYKSMKPYIEVADEMKANEMKKFNNITFE